ncbi:MAG: class I SAM-dependent methyltransferase [Chloroflexi bacterium]|nr:class I SAM-dependent methyltransferase [Chloroflexota bacterium]
MNVSEYEAMYRVEDTLWWYVGMRRIAVSVLDGTLRPNLTILDAGCGTGGNLAWLSSFGQAYGVDLSPHALRFCAERRLTTASRASILELPFADSTFDLVTSFDVIYHLGVRDDVAALAEMRRVLKPGGVALIRVPALEQLRSTHDAAVHTRQRYTLEELCRKLDRTGLEVVRASYANSLLFPLAVVARIATRLAARLRGGDHAGELETHRSDVRPAPPAVNALFGAAMRLEAAALARVDLPIGLSVLAVARKPASVEPWVAPPLMREPGLKVALRARAEAGR